MPSIISWASGLSPSWMRMMWCLGIWDILIAMICSAITRVWRRCAPGVFRRICCSYWWTWAGVLLPSPPPTLDQNCWDTTVLKNRCGHKMAVPNVRAMNRVLTVPNIVTEFDILSVLGKGGKRRVYFWCWGRGQIYCPWSCECIFDCHMIKR